MPDERLPGRPDEQRCTQRCEARDGGEQREVVLEGLPEADPGVEGDRVRGDPCGDRGVACRGELCRDLTDDVVEVRCVLHGARLAAQVHRDVARTGDCDDVEHPVVGSERADVVHDRRTGGERGAGHRRVAGVDGDDDTLGREPGDDGDDTRELLVDRDGLRTGPRRLSPHVDTVGAGSDERQTERDRALR